MKAREALFGSFKILGEKPIFLLPMIIVVVLSAVFNLLALGTLPTWFLPAFFVLYAIMIVLDLLVYGMYPSMVRDHIEKRELNLKDSLHFSYHKFWSLLGAILLAALVIVAVILAITIPLTLLFVYTQSPAAIIGMIIAMIIVAVLLTVFFYYIIPAILMDDMKAVAGFRRSIEVTKKNYLFTLLIILIPTAIIYAIYGVFIGLPMYLGAANYISTLLMVIGSIVVLFITTWIAITMNYAYYNIRT
ncbi:MAG: hypothetical protein MASP_00443 [Candidatus Methanolliviera sp. GoM_asphalt]|nr:MAG: hypothetical protein MASP_00443 [Candidatus Methanolliviera sp. GoM_asphalt]